MKAYILPNENNPDSPHAIGRVVEALSKYAPKSVDFDTEKDEADLVVLHVVGRRDAVQKEVERLQARGQKYAVIQYAIRSTKTPNTHFWLATWARAQAVWSYYDIKTLCQEDKAPVPQNLYFAPLGVDSKIFKVSSARKDYSIISVGQSWLTESVREVYYAAEAASKPAVFTGPFAARGHSHFVRHVSDKALAELYRQSDYVSGLRRVEGFELPAAEGLLCGARPILFDRPHYRGWYKSWAEYIPEAPREEVIDSLTRLLTGKVRRVTAAERNGAQQLFNWQKIVKGFWERVL